MDGKNVLFALAAAFCIVLAGENTAFSAASVTTLADATFTEGAKVPYSTLVGPVLTENANRDISKGTIILNAPIGFVFDPTAAITATVSRIGGTGTTLSLGSGGIATVTVSNITISVSTVDASSGAPLSSITWSGIRVRPATSMPLGAGNITKSGTASVIGIASGTSFGALTEITTQAPAAGNDLFLVAPNTALTVAAPGVLTNDTDPNGYSLTAALWTGPSHGILNFYTNGSFVYTPAPGFTGIDSFSYQASDLLADSGLATVTINVGQWVTNTYNFTYSGRTALLADGWDFMARNPGNPGSWTSRNTERTSGPSVVSYNQAAHPGVLRIPVDQGDLWANLNNSGNSLFRDLSSNWVSLRLQFSFTPSVNYQQAHLSLYQDDDNYLEIGHSYNSSLGGETVEFARESGGDRPTSSPLIIASASVVASTVFLRLDRDLRDDKISGFYSLDGANWLCLGDSSQQYVNPRLCIWTGGSYESYPPCDLRQLSIVSTSPSLIPALIATPQRLLFNAVAGTPCTNLQQLRVVSRHSWNPVAWSVSTNASWLSGKSGSGTTPGVCEVSVNTAALAAGIYQGIVGLNAPDTSSAFANVTLIVNPASRVKLASWQGGKNGAMSVTMDDSQLTAFDDLSTNGFAGTYMLWLVTPIPQTFADYYRAGMELGAHTVDHWCSMDQMDEPTLRYEFASNIVGIDDATPEPQTQVISFAWPCGVTGVFAESVASDYFLSCRGYNLNQLEDPTPYDFMCLKSFNSHEHDPSSFNSSAPPNPTDLKTGVDGAIAQGKWFNMVLHATNDSDGAIGYAVGKDIWVAPQGAVVKYIVQRDRTVISNYVETSNLIQFDTWRLPLDPSPVRSFETALGPQDVITFKVATNGLSGVLGVSIGGVQTPCSIKQGAMVFNALVTTSPQRILITVGLPQVLTVSADSKSRGYGQTNLLTGSLTGLINGDVITATFTTTATSSSPVGSYVITPLLSDPGGKLGNYIVITNTGTLNVTQALLTVTADSKTRGYGQTNALFTGNLTGVTNSDAISATFITTATSGSPVGSYVITPLLSDSGGKLGNYSVITNTGMLSVTQAVLTVSGTGTNKIYDGNLSASVGFTDNRVPGDIFTINYSAATFADKNIGANKTISISGLVIAGGASTNYALSASTATTAANITARAITVSAASAGKTYDGTRSSTGLPTITTGSLAAGDSATFSQTFNDKNVGTGKTLSPSGSVSDGNSGSNYAVTFVANLSGAITTKTLVVGATGCNKVYDGLTNATVTLSDNRLSGDLFFNNYASAAFVDKNVGTAKVVNVSGITVNGTDASNYTANTTGSATADITAANLVVGADNKSRPYGQTNPVFTATITGWVNGENTNALGETLVFNTLARTNTPVGVYDIIPSGLTSTNYAIAFSNGTLTVTIASSSIELTSRPNPSMQNSNVTFSATLSPVAPAATIPTGSVQFMTNGAALGQPVSLLSGVATIDTTFWNAGSNTVTAAYLGDGNFLGSTNSLVQVVNLYLLAPSVLGIQNTSNHTVTITFSGTPLGQYLVQTITDLTPPGHFESFFTNTADSNGLWTFTESTTNHPQRYYRAAKP